MLRIFLPRETSDGSVFCSEPPIKLNLLELETCLSCTPFLRGKSAFSSIRAGRHRGGDGVGRDQLRDCNYPSLTPRAPQVGPALPFPPDRHHIHGNTLQSAASLTASYFCSLRERAVCQEHNGCCVPWEKNQTIFQME